MEQSIACAAQGERASPQDEALAFAREIHRKKPPPKLT